MKRRRAKSRASDDNRRALELALSGGGDTVTGTSSGKDAKAAKSDGPFSSTGSLSYGHFMYESCAICNLSNVV